MDIKYTAREFDKKVNPITAKSSKDKVIEEITYKALAFHPWIKYASREEINTAKELGFMIVNNYTDIDLLNTINEDCEAKNIIKRVQDKKDHIIDIINDILESYQPEQDGIKKIDVILGGAELYTPYGTYWDWLNKLMKDKGFRILYGPTMLRTYDMDMICGYSFTW